MAKMFDIVPKPKPSHHSPSSTAKKRSSLSNFLFAGILIFLLIIIANVALPKTKPSEEPNNNALSINQPTSTATNTTSQATSPSPTPTQKQTEAATSSVPTDNVDKSAIKIKLLNGSGKSGLAQQVKTQLESKGFSIVTTGTAKNLYSTTTIYYTTNNQAQAQLLKDNLDNKNCKIQENNQLTSGYDLLIVLGTK